MTKLKYQGGVTKLIASKIGNSNKRKFSKLIENNLGLLRQKMPDMSIELDVVSFSSGGDYQEQVLSILSFLRYVGTPESWILYSDGSHTEAQISSLEAAFEFLHVEQLDWNELTILPESAKRTLLPYSRSLLHYAKEFPLGKKLLYYLNHKIVKPTLFVDSDILFYLNASLFREILKEKIGGWYLPDTDWACLDSRYMEQNIRQQYQVNAGCFLLNRELLKLEEGLDFLSSLNLEYEYFSEQTVFHILFRCNNFMPFDPRLFILDSGDQFDFSYLVSRKKMFLRHYTGPVRHKMWQRSWKWHLSLS